MNCPTCGRPLGDDWRPRRGVRYGMGTAPALEPGMSFERRKPGRALESQDWRAVGGLALGSWATLATVGLVVTVWQWDLIWFKRGAIGGVFVGAVIWFLFLVDLRSLVHQVERLTGADIDQDGHVGKPEPVVILKSPGTPRPHDSAPAPQVTTTHTVNGNRRLALDLAEFLARGADVGFGIRGWTGRQLSSGTTVTDSSWRQWVGWLRDAELLESDNSGTRLTVDLDTALQCILSDWRAP